MSICQCFWPYLYSACTEITISDLTVNILTSSNSSLDSATKIS